MPHQTMEIKSYRIEMLVNNIVPVWIQRFLLNPGLRFLIFFFLAALFNQVNYEQCTSALFTDPQISLFSNFFIKNGSHDTIHTFKNYFITVFSISVKISSI